MRPNIIINMNGVNNPILFFFSYFVDPKNLRVCKITLKCEFNSHLQFQNRELDSRFKCDYKCVINTAHI